MPQVKAEMITANLDSSVPWGAARFSVTQINAVLDGLNFLSDQGSR